MYFAVAEALQNTAKHAGSGATARITLSHERSRLSFEVRDDGYGFAGDVNAGRGLANMDDRLRAVGGRLRVSSAPGCGTSVQGSVTEVEPLRVLVLPANRSRRPTADLTLASKHLQTDKKARKSGPFERAAEALELRVQFARFRR